MPSSLAAIATRKVKWDKRYQEKYGITTHAAEDLPPQVLASLDRLSRRIYRALGLSGYARMDFRVTPQGQVYVLEANANPNLEAAEDFAESARAAGTPYPRAARAPDGPWAQVPRAVAGDLWLRAQRHRGGSRRSLSRRWSASAAAPANNTTAAR